MMEWSYLYLAVPPAVALCAAAVAARLSKRSASRIDRMQDQYDEEERDRATLRKTIDELSAYIEQQGGKPAGAYKPSAYPGGAAVVSINPKDATKGG